MKRPREDEASQSRQRFWLWIALLIVLLMLTAFFGASCGRLLSERAAEGTGPSRSVWVTALILLLAVFAVLIAWDFLKAWKRENGASSGKKTPQDQKKA